MHSEIIYFLREKPTKRKYHSLFLSWLFIHIFLLFMTLLTLVRSRVTVTVALSFSYGFVTDFFLCQVVYQIAELYNEMQDLPQAQEQYRILTGQVPTDPKVLAKLGTVYADEKEHTQAFHQFLEVGQSCRVREESRKARELMRDPKKRKIVLSFSSSSHSSSFLSSLLSFIDFFLSLFVSFLLPRVALFHFVSHTSIIL